MVNTGGPSNKCWKWNVNIFDNTFESIQWLDKIPSKLRPLLCFLKHIRPCFDLFNKMFINQTTKNKRHSWFWWLEMKNCSNEHHVSKNKKTKQNQEIKPRRQTTTTDLEVYDKRTVWICSLPAWNRFLLRGKLSTSDVGAFLNASTRFSKQSLGQ